MHNETARSPHGERAVPVPPALLPIPAGVAVLSDRRTQRRWSTPVRPFLLAAVQITQAEYSAAPSAVPDAPAVNVSWEQAVRFCNLLSEREGLTPAYSASLEWNQDSDGYRLPTEAEWEHACRAGTTGPRYGPLDEIAWYRGNSGDRLHEVAGRAPNAWGLHDMLGNAWDWCWDVYDAEVYGSYRVLRGGGWFDEHWSCRASVRRRSHPTFQVDDVGFRVARSVT
jgi:formylglycine-generating enzyme